MRATQLPDKWACKARAPTPALKPARPTPPRPIEMLVTAGGRQGALQGGFNQERFVKEMMSQNQLEIQLGELAQQKATNEQVKQIAQMIAQDHQKAQQQLQQIAQSENIQAEAKLNPVHQAILGEMSQLQGPEFDRAFVYGNVAGHQMVRCCSYAMLPARPKARRSSSMPRTAFPRSASTCNRPSSLPAWTPPEPRARPYSPPAVQAACSTTQPAVTPAMPLAAPAQAALTTSNSRVALQKDRDLWHPRSSPKGDGPGVSSLVICHWSFGNLIEFLVSSFGFSTRFVIRVFHPSVVLCGSGYNRSRNEDLHQDWR